MNALRGMGVQVAPSIEAREILDGMFYVSGEVPRVSFEGGITTRVRQNDGREWESDPDIVDERFVAVHVGAKGLVVLTGCSHADIVLTHCRHIFPGVPV